MKNFLFTIIIICLSFSCLAQEGFSVHATGCIGPFGNGAQLGLDYRWGRFSLGTGFAYITSEYGVPPESTPFPSAYNYQQRYVFRHFILPVSLGYRIPVGNRFSIMPMINIAAGYNFSAKFMAWEDHYINLYERRLSKTEFQYNYRQASFWAGGGVRFAYKITGRFSILAEVQGRATVIALNKDGNSQRSSNAGLSWGLQYNFYD